jgi:kynureninase
MSSDQLSSSSFHQQEPHWASEAFAHHQDQLDPLKQWRNHFHIPSLRPHATQPFTPEPPSQQTHYLCGNSLGPSPIKAQQYVHDELDKWRHWGVEGHFTEPYPWFSFHEPLTPMMAALVGAKNEEVVICNTLTVNLHLLLVSFFRPHGQKRKILMEQGAFPSDIYALKSQLLFHGLHPELDLIELCPRPGEETLRTEDILQTINRHASQLALILVGGVHYRTGQLLPLKEMAAEANRLHIPFGVDLAHAAGNVSLELHRWNIDFAVWCTYKYLNGGPGSLGGLFVHEKHLKRSDLPRFAGWWGHNKENRFRMDNEFDAIPSAEAWQLSNPPIFSLAALRASLEIFSQVSFASLVHKSHHLTHYLLKLLDYELGDHVQIITPRHHEERGGQISFTITDDRHRSSETLNARQLVEQLGKNRIICDFRSPSTIRLAAAPLYNNHFDFFMFVKTLKSLLEEHL